MSGAGELRITRLERSSAGEWLFAFAADDSDTLFAGIALVKALPEQRRRYRKDERAWWIASEALGALLDSLPSPGAPTWAPLVRTRPAVAGPSRLCPGEGELGARPARSLDRPLRPISRAAASA